MIRGFKHLCVLLLACALGVAAVCGPPAYAAAPETVYVVPLSGEVDPGMAAFVGRVYREISDSSYKLVIFEINTFGGRVDSAFEIVDTLLKFPKEKSVAFVDQKAISAGALIALACGTLAMAPGTTIGDTAPIAVGQGGPRMMGEKFQSPIRAKFRALAERNGFPVAMAEAMVTPEKVVYQLRMKSGETRYLDAQAYDDLSEADKEQVASRKTVVEEGELLTMHAAEALDYDFSKMTVAGIPELLDRLGVGNYEIKRITPSWSEVLVRFIGSIAPILMMIGLAALYIEMKAPGFGLPGAIGVLCIGAVFLNQYLVGLANYTELLLILVGLVLMGIEVFVLPGFGLAGFLGIASIVIGLVLALQGFVIPDPRMPWQMDLLVVNLVKVLGSYLLAFGTGLFFLRYVMPQFSSRSEGPYLMANLGSAHADSEETKRAKVGDEGVALTFLRPSGKAEINADIFDVATENEFVEKGAPIVVTKIRGNWIVVERKDLTG